MAHLSLPPGCASLSLSHSSLANEKRKKLAVSSMRKLLTCLGSVSSLKTEQKEEAAWI